MPKRKSKSRPAKKAKPARGSKPAKSAAPKKAAAKSGGVDFNHAMVYSRDVARSIDFYRGRMGFKLIEDFRHEGQSVYARLHAPAGQGTIAIHQAPPGALPPQNEGVRLYFEIRELDDFCAKLQRAGLYFTQPPRMMPWGWRHAYLDDPDGHEISLYWAGENRMKKTVMQAAKEAKRVPKAKRPR